MDPSPIKDKLDSVSGPEIEPSKNADAKTAEEEKIPETRLEPEKPKKQKALSPTEKHDALNRDIIEFHKCECTKYADKCDKLQSIIDSKSQIITDLSSEVSDLRSTAKATGCLALTVTVVIGVGGGLIGLAGSYPNLSDDNKHILNGAGIATIVLGFILSAAVYYLTPSSTKKSYSNQK